MRHEHPALQVVLYEDPNAQQADFLGTSVGQRQTRLAPGSWLLAQARAGSDPAEGERGDTVTLAANLGIWGFWRGRRPKRGAKFRSAR